MPPFTPVEPSFEPGPSDAIDRDLHCARCGYNLRMRAVASECPECGLPVRDSLSPDSLVTAPNHWLSRQLAGVWIQFASYLLAGVAIFAEMYRTFIPGLTGGVMMLLRVTPLLGIAVAVWLLTSPRPDRQFRPSRWIVRYGFAAVLVLGIVVPGIEHAGFHSALGRVGWSLFFLLLVVCWIGLGCVQVRIARTLGLTGLSAFLWAASIVWSIALASTALFYVFREFTERSLFSRAEPAYVYTLVIGGVLVLTSALTLAIAFTLRRSRGGLPGSKPLPREPSPAI